MNLYGFVGNNGIDTLDRLGLKELAPNCCLNELKDMKSAKTEKDVAITLLASSQNVLDRYQEHLDRTTRELDSMGPKIRGAISEVNWARSDMAVNCEQGHGSFANSGCQLAITRLTKAQIDRDELLEQQATLRGDVTTGRAIVNNLTGIVDENRRRVSRASTAHVVAATAFYDCVSRNASVKVDCPCI